MLKTIKTYMTKEISATRWQVAITIQLWHVVVAFILVGIVASII